MNSITSLTARQYRLKQWAEEIKDCKNRPVDLTVSEWCRQHDLNQATYYYHLREVQKACLENLPNKTGVPSIIPIPSELMANEENLLPSSELKVSVNGVSIHVSADTSPELLKMVLQVAANVK